MSGILWGNPPRLVNRDEQHIERLRRTITSFDRWRRFLTVLYLFATFVFMIALIGSAFLVHDIGRFLGKMGVGITPGFLLGIALGSWLGIGAIGIVHGLYVVTSGLRNERLLLRYFDTNRELRDQIALDSAGDAGLVDPGVD